MNETISLVLISIGLFFNLIGTVGLIRFPDVYARLQVSTKCVTFGTGLILFGTFVAMGFSNGGVKALMAGLFILMAVPAAAHALARGAHRAGIQPKGAEGAQPERKEER